MPQLAVLFLEVICCSAENKWYSQPGGLYFCCLRLITEKALAVSLFFVIESSLQGVHQDSPCGSSDKSVFPYSPMKAFTQNQRALAKVLIAQCCLIVPQPPLALAE